MLLIDNLDITENRKVDGFRYDTDGTNTIENNRVEINTVPPQFRNGFNNHEREYEYVNINHIIYSFDKNFKLTSVYDFYNTIEIVDISTIDEQSVKQEIYEMMKPVLEVHEKEPSLNLQWLFNLLNYDKFN